MGLVLVSFTLNLQLHACPLLLKHSTINISLLHLKIASETPNHGNPRTKRQTHSILTSEFLFYILSSEQSAYFLQFVQLEVQTYTFLCPLLQHEEKRMCTCQVCQTKESKITFVEEYMSIG